MLGSTHAPLDGTGVLEVVRMYSAAWQKCEPANAATHSACICGLPPTLPVVVVVVNPAKRVLRAPLQHASERETLHTESVTLPALVMYVPLLPVVPFVHVEQL